MIHPIVKYGDPVLETPGKRVEKFDDELQKLIGDMFESMYAAARRWTRGTADRRRPAPHGN